MAVKKWVAKVQTESTFPEEHLFNQDAETIAKHLASKKVSPKGPASGMRMLNYYINRGGKNLSKERHAELEKAKRILSEIIADLKVKSTAKKAASKKAVAKVQAKKRASAKRTPTAKKRVKAAI